MSEQRVGGVPDEVVVHLRLMLVQRAAGRQRAQSRATLRAWLAAAGLPHGDRMVRRAIRRVIAEGLPVGGGNRGYWVCADAADLAEGRGQMIGRICAMSRRAKLLRSAFVRYNGGQGELAFDGAEAAAEAAADAGIEQALERLAAAAGEGDDDDE